MGKAVPSFIKMKSKDLMEVMPDSFTTKFDENKKELKKLELPFSKEIQNHMAAYIARQKEVQKEQKV